MKKGAKASEFGPVIGSTFIGQIFLSLLIGKLVAKVGIGISFTCGWLFYTLVSTSFAFLTFVDDTKVFLALAYILRIAQGVLNNVIWCSVLSLMLAW